MKGKESNTRLSSSRYVIFYDRSLSIIPMESPLIVLECPIKSFDELLDTIEDDPRPDENAVKAGFTRGREPGRPATRHHCLV